jgi:hypothetical protein
MNHLNSRLKKLEQKLEPEDEDFTEFVLQSGEIVRIPAGLSLVDIVALASARTDQAKQ